MQRIRARLDQGTSLNDIVASLAGSLAASVAKLLGISPDVAKQRLTQAFTAALAPFGTGPPQTNAERASTLVQRFRQIAELATRVTKEDPGHTIRSISGQSSDAEQAGAKPAPPDTIIRNAILALADPVSSVTTTNASPATPAAPATGADGRFVSVEPDQRTATGGDTLLGRILTRATVPAEPHAPLAAPLIATPEEAAIASVTPNPPGVKTIGPSRVAPAPGASSPAPDAVASTPTGAEARALDAFVQAFAAALGRNDAASSTRDSRPVLRTDPAVNAASDTAPQQAIPFAIPFTKDAVPVAPVQASTMPEREHVDANAVVDQLLRGVSVRTTDGSSEVRLRLVPESLGDVSVKLVVSGGSVDASITTHNADAQSVLAGAQNQLAKTLADAGLKLQSFTVALAGGAFAGNRDNQTPNPWAGRSSRRIGGVESIDTPDGDDLGLAAIPSFGPPIFSANPLQGAFNYLV